MLPMESLKIPKWTISQPQPLPEYGTEVGAADSYYRASGSYAESELEEKERVSHEEEIGSLPPILTNSEAVYEPTSPFPLTSSDAARTHAYGKE